MQCVTAAVLFAIVMFPVFAQDAPPPAPTVGELGEREFAALHELKAEASPKPTGVDVEVAGQHHYLSLPKDRQAPLAAVLVIHEWWGLNDHIRHWADRIAGEGYAALAVDLYRGKVASKPEEAQQLMKTVDPEQAKATLRAALAFLRADARVRAPKLASLGWCFGGHWSLQCALLDPSLDACVLYYGRLITDEVQLDTIRAPVLGVFGLRDRSIPAASRDGFEAAMKRLHKSVRLLTYDAEHAFANPSGARYDQANAARAWTEVRAFLANHLTIEPGERTPQDR